MVDKRPSVAGAFLSVLGLGAVAVATVAIALSFSASSAQRIESADRDAAAIDLLEQRHTVTGLFAAELAGSVLDEFNGGETMVSAPLTARRNTTIETASASISELATRNDSVGHEAQRLLAAITTKTDPIEIENTFERFVAYDDLRNAACCGGVVPSDGHHTENLRELEASASVSSSTWNYLYTAMELASRIPPAAPPLVNQFLEHLGTPARLAPDPPLPSAMIAGDLDTFAALGVRQEAINTLLAGDAIQTLDRIVLAASGRPDADVAVGEAFVAVDSVTRSLDELYQQALAANRNRLSAERDTAEQIRLIATVVTPLILLVLIGMGIVVYRAARNREEVLEHERNLLDARNRFMRMVSHELRTPATAISGFAQMLSDEWKSLTETEISEFLAIVDRQSTHLSLIVDDLLTLSHLETGRLRLQLGLVDLKQAADDAIGMVDARYGIEVESSIDPAIILVADPDRLVQILRNLVENAAKYGKTDVAVAATIEGAGCRIVVSDTGPGVPADAAKRIFRFWDRGAHKDDLARGHGMGLAIARHLARAMVGDLIYQPHQPMGSEFVLTLPLGTSSTTPTKDPVERATTTS